MADLESIVTDDSLNGPPGGPGTPTGYRIVQIGDVFEIRAYYGANVSGAYDSVASFMANKETHLYGECVMWDPAIRHVGVLSLNNVEDGTDIVSFRTGSAPGSEVARITVDGRVTVLEREAYVSMHASAFFRNFQGSTHADAGLVPDDPSIEEGYLATDVLGAVRIFCSGFPTRIPEGATVTAIGMAYRVRSGGEDPDNYVKVIFYRTKPSNNDGDILHTLTSDGGTGSLEFKEESLTVPETISYEAYSYGIRVVVKNTGEGQENTSRFYVLRVTYTFTDLGA